MTGSSAPTDASPRHGRVRERIAWAVAVLGLTAVVVAVGASALGWSMLIFRSGSMSPDIPAGALAVARPVPVAEISPGDVVSVISQKNDDRITHRVVDVVVGEDGVGRLTLRGDANAANDQELYRATTVDRVVMSAPWLGYPVAFLLSPVGLVVLCCAALALVVVAFGGRDRRDDRPSDDRPSDDRPSGGRRRRGRAAAVAAGAAVMALGVGSTSGTLAAFSDSATLASGSYGANPYFTCNAAATGVGSPYFWWRMDDTSIGAVADSSGNSRPGQMVVGSNGFIARGPSAACSRDSSSLTLRFDGATSYVGQPDGRSAIAGPNTYTASLWFQTSTSRGGNLISFGSARTGSSGQHDRHLYMTDAGRLRYGVYTGGAVRTVLSDGAYNDGAWHQAVSTLSSGGLRLYVDGELVASDAQYTTGESFNGFWRVAYDNLSGWTDDPTSDFFAGSLDNVTVYSTALTADQVRAAYRAGVTA